MINRLYTALWAEIMDPNGGRVGRSGLDWGCVENCAGGVVMYLYDAILAEINTPTSWHLE